MLRFVPFLLVLNACDEATDLQPDGVADLGDSGADPAALPDLDALPPPTLTKFGLCPGPVTFSVTGATPSGNLRFVWGIPGAAITVPTGPCAGLQIQVASPTVSPLFTASATGTLTVPALLPVAACGKFAYVVDLGTCTTGGPIPL